MSPGSEGLGHWGACFLTVPRVRTMAPCQPFPRNPGALACQRKGTWETELLPSALMERKMRTPVSLSSGPRQRLPSPGQGWVPENAAFLPPGPPVSPPPHLPCLPLTALVLCSLATVFIPKVPRSGGLLSIPWGMECLCLPEPRHRSPAESLPLAPPVLPVY